jgi:DNA-binding transcriptional regulator YiaG
MTHAYAHIYLADAEACLAGAFDYATCDCRLPGGLFADLFSHSQIAREFERGNPCVVSGMSGIELASEVLESHGLLDEPCEPVAGRAPSPAFWCGELLARYQWERACRFADVLGPVPYARIEDLYHPFHEADTSRAVEQLDLLLSDSLPHQTKLARLRALRHLSQAELAARSKVGLKSIQAYEQRVNSINRASGETLRHLANALRCPIESLLEFEPPQVAIEYLPRG